jgi:2-aminoethylphosphonate-pyruvate transaminase
MSARASVAVVLAAGLGSRLQSVHSQAPKGFVDVGGEPIIQRSLDALHAAGIHEFIIVVGWMADHYRRWAATQSLSITCVENAEYAMTGSLASLMVGCAGIPDRDIVIVESDLLYDPRAAAMLLTAPSRDTLLASGFTKSGDEVWVYGTDHLLEQLSKQPLLDRIPVGELVGLTRLSAETVRALSVAARLLPASVHYEDGLNAVAATHNIALLVVPDLAWCEIDDEHHLERARTLVWPRITHP